MASPFYSGRIPQELYDRAEEYAKEAGISKTQLLINALTIYLGKPLSSDKAEMTNALEDRLSKIENRLDTLESSVISSYQSDKQFSDKWLTTGEAYEEAQRRGYTKSIGTFRRSLSTGNVPKDLEKLGLVADFIARQRGNTKDNSLKWLQLT